MKQTNNPTQKKMLTLNKVTVAMFATNVVNSKNGGKKPLFSVVNTTASANCYPTLTA
ncbi:hypothetical protein [Chitinophaga sp.]|uniref:hypothetical protein n=1 Tax=Chitinophaga sp. TaxID=1869181 RepID=UPI0031DA9147